MTDNQQTSSSPAVIDYEGSDYRERFWENQGRNYEDLAERIALDKLLPARGRRLVELGAGFGRLASLYNGYEEVILLDYSRSLLREAQERLGHDPRFLFVAADLYRLPLVDGAVDTAVTVRVMHHLADVPAALGQFRRILAPGGVLVAEYANKRNLKAVLRYLVRRQAWSPFERLPYEFVALNFDFHPAWMSQRLQEAGLDITRELTVSHFRLPLLKRLVPAPLLAKLDGAVQGIGATWKLSPSIFLRCTVPGSQPGALPVTLFQCPQCQGALSRRSDSFDCPVCSRRWPVSDGLFDFKESLPIV